MRVIPAALHRVLDYVTVLAFLVAPTLLSMSGTTATLSYALAVIHLIMTLCTKYFSNGKGFIPFRLHGSIELLVGIALLALPFAMGWIDNARVFYATCGVVFGIVWFLTDYRELPATV